MAWSLLTLRSWFTKRYDCDLIYQSNDLIFWDKIYKVFIHIKPCLWEHCNPETDHSLKDTISSEDKGDKKKCIDLQGLFPENNGAYFAGLGTILHLLCLLHISVVIKHWIMLWWSYCTICVFNKTVMTWCFKTNVLLQQFDCKHQKAGEWKLAICHFQNLFSFF